MIASWILYALAVSALVSVAALAAERALGALRWPTRFVWIAGVALSALWPCWSLLRPLLPASRAVTVLPFTITVAAPPISDDAAVAAARLAMIDRVVVVAWIVLSAILLLRIARGVVALQRSRAAWKRKHVDGVFVKLSDNVGPAVIGLRDMEMVLPEWILTLDAPLRAIVLRHEEEHRRARDPYLLFAAAVAVALMPWNAALWFQARRLRLAIELDCDARVLRAHPSPERYGLLMLAIAQRRAAAPAMFAPMLTEPRTQLERRILAMRNTTRKLVKGTVYGGGAVALASLAFASSLQSATANVAARAVTLPEIAAPRVLELAPTKTHAPAPVRRQQQGNPAPRYPDMLRAANVEGAVIVRFNTDSKGIPDSSSIVVVTSTHDLFSNSVRAVLPKWHLAPNSSMNMPFVFVLANKTAAELGDLTKGIAANAVVVTAAPVQGLNAMNMTAVTQAPATATAGEPRVVSADQTFFEFQVEKPVSAMPGNPGARYPDMLRQAHVEGSVLAQFVVGPDGLPDLSTFKVLKSDHDLFTNAVKSALPNMRFYPAQVGGQPVRQLVQMPFNFNLTKEP